jgi:hypothetical protein
MNLQFCYLKTINVEGAFQAMSFKGKQWAIGDTIDIAFMGGTSKQREEVKLYADELSKIVNLKLNFGARRDKSEVRISFVRGGGSWSYIGTDALFISKDKPTMNLGWIDKAVVLHEFCHMLGLGHEHANPLGGIQWNRDRVLKDLSGPPNNWDYRTIEHNVLNAVKLKDVDATEFDPKSIMLYSFPAEWTVNGVGTNKNTELSEIDKEHLRKLYPFTNTVARRRPGVIRRAIQNLKDLW